MEKRKIQIRKNKEINNIKFNQMDNINENIFCARDINRKIHFYNTNDYKCIGEVKYKEEMNYIGNISEELIIFEDYYCPPIY